jgi:hypothetical protein
VYGGGEGTQLVRAGGNAGEEAADRQCGVGGGVRVGQQRGKKTLDEVRPQLVVHPAMLPRGTP